MPLRWALEFGQDLGLEEHGPCASYLKMPLAFGLGTPPPTFPVLLSLKPVPNAGSPEGAEPWDPPIPPRKAAPQSFVEKV